MHADYLKNIFDPAKRKFQLEMAKRELAGVDFDSIVVNSGVSGMFGAMLAAELNVGLVVVRKRSCMSHSDLRVEMSPDAFKFVIVDDCVSSGNTISSILNGLATECVNKGFSMSAKGVYLYNHGEFYTFPFKYMKELDIYSRYPRLCA